MNDRVEFDIIPKTNEEYISVTYGCVKFIYSYGFLSNSLASLAKNLVDNFYISFKDFEEGIVDNEEIFNSVNEMKILSKKDKYKNDSIKDLHKDYPDEI